MSQLPIRHEGSNVALHANEFDAACTERRLVLRGRPLVGAHQRQRHIKAVDEHGEFRAVAGWPIALRELCEKGIDAAGKCGRREARRMDICDQLRTLQPDRVRFFRMPRVDDFPVFIKPVFQAFRERGFDLDLFVQERGQRTEGDDERLDGA